MIQTETALCGYCEELPEKGRAAAAHVNRCPLCKAELGITSSGRRFRIGVDAPAPRGRMAIMAALACAGCVMVLAVAAWTMIHSDPAVEIVVPPPEPTPIVKARPVVVERQAPALPQDVAAIKPYAEGVLSPEARVKPEVLVRPQVASPSQAASGYFDVPAEIAQRPGRLDKAVPLVPAKSPGFAEVQRDSILMSAPEVGLPPPVTATDTSVAAKQAMAKFARDIDAKNKDTTDGFIRSLIEGDGDLAGLPYLLGKSCQLGATQAEELMVASLSIRRALTAVEGKESSRSPLHSSASTSDGKSHTPYTLWNHLRLYLDDLVTESPSKKAVGLQDLQDQTRLRLLPGLSQILAPAAPLYRIGLVEQIQHLSGAKVTQTLARLALYDPDPDVRIKARMSLRKRPAAEYTDVLLDGLRYPWPAVAQRAADATVELERRDMVGRLIDLLGAADPSEPFEREVQGKKVTVVRQLVKINHHRNCLLCHAPSTTPNRDIPQALVPSPAEPLPPSNSVAYYAQRKGETVVRADITYLRQDFSMMLPVAHAAPWPEMQRFDFLVRTRALTDSELDAFQKQKQVAGPFHVSLHREAIISALCRLTGLDLGASAEAWRQAVAHMQPPSQAAPGRVDCRK